MWVWDVDGRKFLDFSAGIAVNALGHADEGVLKASLISFHGWFYFSLVMYRIQFQVPWMPIIGTKDTFILWFNCLSTLF